MPDALLDGLTDQARQVTNLNNNPVLRSVASFPDDITAAIHKKSKGRLDIRKL